MTDAMAHAELASEGSTYQLTWPEALRLEAGRLDAMLWPVGLMAGELLTSTQLSRLKSVPPVHGCFLISPRT